MNIKTFKSIIRLMNIKKTSLPVLEYFLLAKDYFFMTNLDMFIRVNHNWAVNDSGVPFMIRTDHFFNCIERIKPPYFISGVAESGKSSVSIEGPTRKMTLFTEYTAADYPEDKLALDALQVGILSYEDVMNMSVASKFTAPDESRPVMAHVLFENEYIVGSDAHKLVFFKHHKDVLGKVLFPVKVIMLMKLFTGKSFTIKVKGNTTFCCSDDVTIWWNSKALGNYPLWRSVLPKDYNKFIILPVQESIEALKGIAFASNEATRLIRFNIESNVAKFSAKNMDFPYLSASESVNIGNPNNESLQEIGFRLDFLIEILSMLSGKGYHQVRVDFQDSVKCMIFENQALLMPMMINP